MARRRFNLSRIRQTYSKYYYYPYQTKSDYDQAFKIAREWALENEEELAITAARLYYVREETLRKSVFRSKNKKRNAQGGYNTYGGNNKILNETQEEAIRQYYFE
jgi:hypothetical protein